MSKIVSLARHKPNEDLVKLLTSYLEAAKKGEIQTMVGIFQTPHELRSFIAATPEAKRQEIIGLLYLLLHDFTLDDGWEEPDDVA